MNVDIILYEGFDELDAVGPFEVFQTAAGAGADCHTRLVTLNSADSVTASHGMRVEPDGTLPDPSAPETPDLLIIPGGGWNDRSAAGAWAEYERGAVPDAAAAHYAAGATVASVCTGGMLLAAAGLLDGRPAVTHQSALDDLRETGAVVQERRVVDDGRVVTAGGVTAGIDLACHLVAREFDEAVATEVATTLEYDRRRGRIVTTDTD